MKSKWSHQRRKVIAILILTLMVSSSALGQVDNTPTEEQEIFPFASGRTLDYSEDFIEIADDGIYDSQGNVVTIIKPSIPKIDPNQKLLSPIEEYQQTILNNWGSKKDFTESRLTGIKQNLEQEMLNFVGLEKKIDQIEKSFEPLREELKSLEEQIDTMNKQIGQSKYKIQNAELQIAEKEIDLKDAINELKVSEARLNIQEKAVLDYIELVYQEEEKFLDYETSGSSTLKLLLADNSVSENLMGKEYSKILENTGRQVFYDLHFQKIALEEKKQDIEKEKQILDELHDSLNDEKRILEEGRATKKELLEETLGEEQRYQELLDESIQQQLESAIAIQNMKDNISYIESKLDLLNDSLVKAEEITKQPGDNLEVEILHQEIESQFSILPQLDRVPDQPEFDWPVPPIAITAEFHDEHYPKKWGQHNAVDLRAKQYTEIKAPENGYVFQAKDNGMGYSYIILAHKNNLVTVYGHVSDIMVKAGTVVKKGDVIGLSGGTPGTKGAGLQTTGPHLHFEVWENGEPVDPLNYLPIFELPLEQIPDKYLGEVK